MKIKAYIVWNWAEKRPAVLQNQYSPMIVFHTLDHARAHEAAQKEAFGDERNCEIRMVELEVEENPVNL